MKKTPVFAILVAVLVAGTYYFEFYKSQKDEEQKVSDTKIVSFPPEQIHRLEIENAKGKIVLTRDTDGWTMLEPVKDWADNQYVEDSIKGLVAESSKETAIEGGKIDWSVYQLDKDFGQITFFHQQNTSVMISVSQKKNFEGDSFLRRNAEEKVLVGSPLWLTRSQATALDFRDKHLFRGKIGSVEEISLKNAKDAFRIVLKDGKWQSQTQPDIKLDQNKVRELLTTLNEVQTTDFLEKLPASEQKAHVELKLKDKTWIADLKQSKDKMIYAQVSEPKFILKMQPGQADHFFDLTFLSLRDLKEPFDFQNLLVEEIEIQTALKTFTLHRKNDQWKMVGDDKAKIEEKAVRNFISRLSDSSVTEYLNPSEQAEFAKADAKMIKNLTLRGADKKVLFHLTWGPGIKKKLLVGEKFLILAKSDLFKDVFALDQTVIDSWGLNSLLPKDAL